MNGNELVSPLCKSFDQNIVTLLECTQFFFTRLIRSLEIHAKKIHTKKIHTACDRFGYIFHNFKRSCETKTLQIFSSKDVQKK